MRPSVENDRYGFLSSDGYPEEGPNPLIKPPPSAENDAPRVNGHAVERYALGWRCVNCDARLLTLMQFQGVECPTRPIPPERTCLCGSGEVPGRGGCSECR